MANSQQDLWQLLTCVLVELKLTLNRDTATEPCLSQADSSNSAPVSSLKHRSKSLLLMFQFFRGQVTVKIACIGTEALNIHSGLAFVSKEKKD